MTTKIVVTHRGALAKKYGAAGWTRIRAALSKMIAADAARGIATTVVELDKGPGGAVSKRPKTFKAAIDRAVVAHNGPDYVLILGGPDVVAHQPLSNPVYDPKGEDRDKTVPSDLPYACDAPYGLEIEAFLGPSRVVGRLPDLPNADSADLLVELIEKASTAKSSPSDKRFFAVSCVEWKRSTTKSVAKLFGTGATPRLSPTEGPSWPSTTLAPKWHFINCHGAPRDPHFYGQQDDDYPEAHFSPELASKISAGTVVAAECCYGAEIYDPKTKAAGIGVTYLREGAMGYLGSTNIAYGPADDNDCADLLCRYFLESARQGASLGRALLESRQQYIAGAAPLDPIALKTIGQFLLLGDPSLHAVATAKPRSSSRSATTRARTESKIVAAHAATRGALVEKAAILTRGTDTVKTGMRTQTSDRIRSKLAATAAQAGLASRGAVRAFVVQPAPDPGARAVVLRGGPGMKRAGPKPGTGQVRFHLMFATPKPAGHAAPKARGKKAVGLRKAAPPAAPAPAGVQTHAILLAREHAGRVTIKKLFARGLAANAPCHATSKARS